MAARRRSGCAATLARSFATLLFFAILFVIGLSVFGWNALNKPWRGYEENALLVEVSRGRNSGQILEQLRSKGILRDDFVPLVYLKVMRRGDSLKAGVYEFREAMSPIAVIDKLVRGDVILRTVVIREGLDRFAVGELMADAGFGSAEDWKRVTGAPDLVRDLSPEAESLEGFLFPDTYKLTPGTTPERIAAVMVQNFRDQFGDQLAFISTGLSIHQTVTLASIVETEARLPAERALIASVYLNRMAKNMRLQADPTVVYALKREGKWDGNIRKADLQMASPYNTYRNAGLPPGPIANPGLASLQAAANPAKSSFLYFVSRNDGSHVFSGSLAEHNRHVQEYQRNFFRRQKQAAAAK
ncbi:MAG TPA: endolytic transglycosylase MltG [Thermoanaerobaculia bacterium]|nr:endolytic transglycosylase MltG [Thermoanaerobaculia bacterium]